MKAGRGLAWVAVLLVVLACQRVSAQAPPPAGATGKCNDGTFTTAAKKWQACGKHKGVASWFADGGAAPMRAGSAATVTTPSPAAAPNSAVAPTATSLGTPGTSTKTAAAKRAAAPGGGPGLVWVNTDSKVYHCAGTEGYGTTKAGKYMSEADAKQAGARPNRNVPCSK